MSRRFPGWIDAAAVIVLSVLIATRQGNQLKWFWGYPPVAHATWLPLSMTTAAAFFGAFQPVSSIRDQKQKPVRYVWDRNLMYTLGELIERCQQIAEESKIQASSANPALVFDFGDLGLHVWKVAWHRRSEWPFYGRELERVKTVRLGSLPALRQISFYKGKGVVGRCWRLNDEVIVDNDSRYGHVQSEADWLALTLQIATASHIRSSSGSGIVEQYWHRRCVIISNGLSAASPLMLRLAPRSSATP
jgi:hypothetical protein